MIKIRTCSGNKIYQPEFLVGCAKYGAQQKFKRLGVYLRKDNDN